MNLHQAFLPLLLVQLSTFHTAFPATCAGNVCQVTPENIRNLQNMIRSDQTIMFDRGSFHIDIPSQTREGFIRFENVTNVLVSGHAGGSHIECSAGANFGFYFKNVSNITVAGLSITNCGALIPQYLERELERSSDLPCDHAVCPPHFTEVTATILVLASENVSLSSVQIAYSSGFAVAAINTHRALSDQDNAGELTRRVRKTSNFSEDSNPLRCKNISDHGTLQSCTELSTPNKQKTYNLVINDCNISHSQIGSLMMYRVSGMLNHTTLGNSSIGLVSTSSDTEIQDTNISQCSFSSLESGSLAFTGTLRINQSSFHFRKHNVRIRNSNVVFTGASRTNVDVVAFLTAVTSELHIDANSKIVFERFNLSGNSSALVSVESTISLHGNSSLKFNDNFASDGASIFSTIKTTVSICNHSSLNFHHNLVRSAWILLAGFESRWKAENDAKIVFKDNSASGGGKLAEFYKTNLRLYDRTRFVLQNNSAMKRSTLAIIEFLFLYSTSRVEVVNNYVIDHSSIFIVSENTSSYDNAVTVFTNNTAIQDSSILIVQRRREEAEVYSYYETLMTEEQEGQQIMNENELEASSFPPPGNFLDDNNSSFELPTVTEGLDGVLNFTVRPGGETSFVGDLPVDIGTFVGGVEMPPQFLPALTFECRDNSKMFFQQNTITRRSVGFSCIHCRLLSTESVALLFNNNTCINSSYVLLLNNATALMDDRTTFEISHNAMSHDSSFLFSIHGMWRVGPSVTLSVSGNTAQNGFLILLLSTMVELNGTVFVQNNVVNDFGSLNALNSHVHFNGRLICSENEAESGVISADNSDIFFTNVALFLSNSAANGGAISLVSSVMHISPNATVNFTRNQASGLGGAVYILNPRTRAVCEGIPFTVASCSFQVLNGSEDDCEFFTLTFNQNRAGIAGNAVYGGQTSACIPSNNRAYCTNCSPPHFSEIFQYNGIGDTSDLSSFTSDPTRVCFCENGVPDCFNVTRSLTVYPGELFHLSLATVGYGLGTVTGSVMARMNKLSLRSPGNSSFGSDLQYSQDIGTECRDLSYSIISEQQSELITLAVSTQSFGRSLETVRAVVDFQLRGPTEDNSPLLRSPYDSPYETFFHIPVFVQVTLPQCPVGFQLVDGRCVCAQILLDNQIDMCFIVNGTPLIHRPSPYWIGLPQDNTSSILIHTQCPYDYCQSDDLNITAENPDEQCQFERSGILCGECREGLSMVLGSSECKTCSNIFLMLLIVFAVAGIALVVFLAVLNMTVSVGTINGLILFANIVQANRTNFLPQVTTHTHILVAILRTFVSWVNLDLGVSTCLFDGLTTYIKTWLQFVFPLYLIAIVSVIITTSYYSTRLTKLFGRNSVSVLATLILLSYTKVLRILITAFSFTTVNDAHGVHSTVWLADGNVEYFEPRYIILFLTALLVLLLFGLPYTATLTVAPWVQRSKYYWISYLYNKFKPLFDAYMGPYKDNCRYWTGLLLIVRVVLIVLFSSFTNTSTLGGPLLNLLLLTLSACGLLALTAAVQPYKKKMNNAIEMFYLTLLILFSAVNLYATNRDTKVESRDYIYVVLVGAAFTFFLGTCIGHIWQRMQLYWSRKLLNLQRSKDALGLESGAGEPVEGENRLQMQATNMAFRESVLDLTSAYVSVTD